MTTSEAFEDLTIICEPFIAVPEIRRIWQQIEARDLKAAYFEVGEAMKAPHINRKMHGNKPTPLYDRLSRWHSTITEQSR